MVKEVEKALVKVIDVHAAGKKSLLFFQSQRKRS